jgi:hypothetical protein
MATMNDEIEAISNRVSGLERRAADEFVTLKELDRIVGLLKQQREASQLVEQQVLELSVEVQMQERVIGHLAANNPNLDAVMIALLEDQDRFLDARTPEVRRLLTKEVERWHLRLLAAKKQNGNS